MQEVTQDLISAAQVNGGTLTLIPKPNATTIAITMSWNEPTHEFRASHFWNNVTYLHRVEFRWNVLREEPEVRYRTIYSPTNFGFGPVISKNFQADFFALTNGDPNFPCTWLCSEGVIPLHDEFWVIHGLPASVGLTWYDINTTGGATWNCRCWELGIGDFAVGYGATSQAGTDQALWGIIGNLAPPPPP